MAYTYKDIERREDSLKDSLDTFNFVEQHLDNGNHLFDRHLDKKTSEHIDRVLDVNTEKPTLRSSSFESSRDMFVLIKCAIRDPNNLTQIAKWLESDRKNELQLDYTPKSGRPTGRGVCVDPKTKKIAEYETNKMTLRLAKNSAFPDGFAVVTAFPVLDKTATPTNQDLSRDMHKTNAYQNANPIDKTLYDIVCNPGYDTEKFSIGTAGPKTNHHTLYLSQLDPVNDAYTHRFSFNARKCLFQTYKSMDYERKPVKTDFISDKDKFNAISMYHNPEGMEQVYEQMPEFGALIEHGYKNFQKSLRKDPEYFKQNTKQKQTQTQDQHTDTKPVKENTMSNTISEPSQTAHNNSASIPRSQRTDLFTNPVTDPTTQQTQADSPDF